MFLFFFLCYKIILGQKISVFLPDTHRDIQVAPQDDVCDLPMEGDYNPYCRIGTFADVDEVVRSSEGCARRCSTASVQDKVCYVPPCNPCKFGGAVGMCVPSLLPNEYINNGCSDANFRKNYDACRMTRCQPLNITPLSEWEKHKEVILYPQS